MSTVDVVIQKQFTSLPDEVTLIILHPAAYSVHRMLSQLLLQSTNAAYAHLPAESDDLGFLLAAIGAAVEGQLQVPVGVLPLDGQAAAHKLAAALNGTRACVLLVEGFDGPRAAHLQDMMQHIAGYLTPGHRVVLSGREMPITLVESPLTKGRLALLPVDDKRMLVDYAHPDPTRIFLEVRAFGQGQVWVNGRPMERWEGFLPRSLFFFFVDRAMTTRDDIFNTFWPNLSTREATNVFHVTKRKVSEILGTNLTVYGAGFYRIAPEIDLRYDVVNFQEAVQAAAIADDEEAQELYQIAIDLYREDFLSGMKGDWIQRRREEMASTYTEALIGLARIHQRRGELDKALGLFLRATATTPHREDLIRGIMQLYHTLGESERALEVYYRLEDALYKTFGVKPDRKTTDLADEINVSLNSRPPNP